MEPGARPSIWRAALPDLGEHGTDGAGYSSVVITEAGGLQGGGINFDAKTRRNSTDLEDLFHAHIGGVDTFARALLSAEAVPERSPYRSLRAERYASFDQGRGADFSAGKLALEDLAELAAGSGEPPLTSGRQERYENILNRYLI